MCCYKHLAASCNCYLVLMNDIIKEIEELKNQLKGDMLTDMEIKDKIHNLEMKLNGTKPENTEIDCIGCGS